MEEGCVTANEEINREDCDEQGIAAGFHGGFGFGLLGNGRCVYGYGAVFVFGGRGEWRWLRCYGSSCVEETTNDRRCEDM